MCLRANACPSVDATKQRQTLRNDFQAACVASVGRCDVDVWKHHIRGHPGPPSLQICAMAFSSLQIFFCQAPQLCCRLRGGGQKRRVDGTPTSANSEGQRQTKGAKQEDMTFIFDTRWTGNAEWHGSKSHSVFFSADRRNEERNQQQIRSKRNAWQKEKAYPFHTRNGKWR